MADPLSISASIAGLVTLADVVYGRVYKYTKAVKSASKDIAHLSREIGGLYGILSNLRLLADQLEDNAWDYTTKSHHIQSCYETLERLKRLLEKDNEKSLNQHDHTIKQKLKWPLKASKVKEIITEIERHKSTLALALSADGISTLLRALTTQADIDEGVRNIQLEQRRRFEVETRVAIDEERQKILDSFGALSPRKNHDMSRKLRYPGTGLWLTESEKFQAWTETQKARLWLYGIPGAGKTVLASLIIDEVLKLTGPGIAAAYFYCDYKDSSTQEPCKILGSLVQQLAKQDGESFLKVQKFYEVHGQGQRSPFVYDSDHLRDLLRDIASVYDCTMIVVDGLDECGSNASVVTELLTSIGDYCNNTDLKFIFLSRNEVEINRCLETWPSISIAAQSSDLKLYVGAEIEYRTRRKMLNVKSVELKDHILERLVNGAEGMFRWVTCQMDYLCELPNDADRRKALKTLPRGLIPTYERILRQIKSSNNETQTLVLRSLKWIAHEGYLLNGRMNTAALCEAVSINLEDRALDPEAVPDEMEILRNCRSLIRRSVDGHKLEFAHFSVQEFFRDLNKQQDVEFLRFHIFSDQVITELCKTCLTYLNLSDFDKGGDVTVEIATGRRKQYRFRSAAVAFPFKNIPSDCWNDADLFSMATKLFSPSKTSTMISWAQDHLINMSSFWTWRLDPDELDIVNHGISEATALHFAAILGLPKLCGWLAHNGCDVNRSSPFGTPLHCAQLGKWSIGRKIDGFEFFARKLLKDGDGSLEAVNTLLQNGADPNLSYHRDGHDYCPLWIAVTQGGVANIELLLERSAIVSNEFLIDIFRSAKAGIMIEEGLRFVFRHARVISCEERLRVRALQLCLESREDPSLVLIQSDMRSNGNENDTIRCNEISLCDASGYGQIDIVICLLDQQCVDSNATDESGKTALHYASEGDHLDVVKVLLEHGADVSRIDKGGANVMHFSIYGKDCCCLSYFLEHGVVSTVTDIDRETVWHWAISEGNMKALKILLKNASVTKFMQENEMKVRGKSLLLFAVEHQSAEAVSLLSDGGFSIFELDEDGCSLLHQSAKAGSPKLIQLLINLGLNASATTNLGSSTIHFAGSSRSGKLVEALKILIENGASPFTFDKSGQTPIDLLVGDEDDRYAQTERNKALKMLANLPGSSCSKQESIWQAINNIIRRPKSWKPVWWLDFLAILIESGVDLSQEKSEVCSLLEALLSAWENGWLNPEYMTTDSSASRDNPILAALEHVPMTGPLHEICSEPKYLSFAIKTASDAVLSLLLDHVASVDEKIKGEGSSLIRTACRRGRSRSIIKRFLQRSTAREDQAEGTILVLEACKTDKTKHGEFLNNEKIKHGVLLELLEAGLDPNGRSVSGQTALMLAAETGNVAVVEELISRGCDVKAKDRANLTIAHYAFTSNNPKIVELLEDKGIDWNAKSDGKVGQFASNGVTVLHLASSHKKEGFLQFLLDQNLCDDVNRRTYHQETPLFLASLLNLQSNVRLLLAKGADPSIHNDAGLSALHIAASCGHLDVMREFIGHDCDLKVLNSQGLNSEMIAWRHNKREMAKLIGEHLQAKRSSVLATESGGNSQRAIAKASGPLKIAIKIGDLALCKRIVQEGVNLDAAYRDCHGCTALLYSLLERRVEISKHLVSIGASPNGRTCRRFRYSGLSIFHVAAQLEDQDLLRMLLEKYPDQYLQCSDALHPLHIAVAYGAVSCVSLLLRQGNEGKSSTLLVANEYVQSSTRHLANLRVGVVDENLYCGIVRRNDTPLIIASRVGRMAATTRSLLEAGGVVDDHDADYATPLHHAALYGNVEIGKLLLSFGARRCPRDWFLDTPAMIASSKGHLEMLQILTPIAPDFQVKNAHGKNLLACAALNGRLNTMMYLLNTVRESDLSQRSVDGASIMETAFFKGDSFVFTALLNTAPSPEVYFPEKVNVLSCALANHRTTRQMMKALLKRLPQGVRPMILNHRAQSIGTPLYAACTLIVPPLQCALIEMLLQSGAELEVEGGNYGTALMGACTMGRIQAVKLLIQKGARLFYQNEEGHSFSALRCAEPFPVIVHWLLIGRFIDGPRRLTYGGDFKHDCLEI